MSISKGFTALAGLQINTIIWPSGRISDLNQSSPGVRLRRRGSCSDLCSDDMHILEIFNNPGYQQSGESARANIEPQVPCNPMFPRGVAAVSMLISEGTSSRLPTSMTTCQCMHVSEPLVSSVFGQRSYYGSTSTTSHVLDSTCNTLGSIALTLNHFFHFSLPPSSASSFPLSDQCGIRRCCVDCASLYSSSQTRFLGPTCQLPGGSSLVLDVLPTNILARNVSISGFRLVGAFLPVKVIAGTNVGDLAARLTRTAHPWALPQKSSSSTPEDQLYNAICGQFGPAISFYTPSDVL